MPTKERRHCKEPQHHFRSDLGDYRGSQAKKTEVHLFCHRRSRRGQDTRWFEHRNTTYREIERALQRFASSPGVPWTIPRHWHCCVGKCLPRAFLGGSRHPRKGEALSEPVLSRERRATSLSSRRVVERRRSEGLSQGFLLASSPGVPWTIPRHWHCCVGQCLLTVSAVSGNACPELFSGVPDKQILDLFTWGAVDHSTALALLCRAIPARRVCCVGKCLPRAFLRRSPHPN